MRLAHSLLGVTVLALALSACGGGGSKADPPAKGSSAPSTSQSTAAPDCATLFKQADASALAGVALGAGHAVTVSGLNACSWDAQKSGISVQVLSVPASQWATILPDAIGTVLKSDVDITGRDKLEDALKIVEKGGKLDDDKACDVFTTMVTSLQGQPAGTTKVYNYVPTDSEPQGINGQACVGGRFYSVQLANPSLKKGTAVETRIRHALDLAIG